MLNLLKNFFQTKYEFFVIPVLLLLGTNFSHNLLGKESLRLDESQSIWQVSRSLNEVFRIIASDVHLPLYGIILYFWRTIVGSEIFDNRQISLIFFLLGIIAIYNLAKLISNNKNIALFVSLIFTVSPYMNWYANELRMYSLLVLLATLSHLFYLRIFFESKFKKLNWILYFVISLLGIYTHYFYFIILLTQVIFYFLFRYNFPKNSFRNFTIIFSCLILSFTPWIYLVFSLGNAKNQTPLLTKPSTVDFFNIYSQQIFGFQVDSVNSLILSFWPILGLLSLLLLKKNNILKPKFVYLGFATFIPIILSFIVSYSVKPIFLSRYLSICVPSMFIIIACVIFSYGKNLSRILRILIVGLMLTSLFSQVASAQTPVKENYREAITYIISSSKKQDIVAISAPFTIFTFDYYYNGINPLVTIPNWDRRTTIPVFNSQSMVNQVNSYVPIHDKIYLLLSYDQGYEKQIKQYFDDNFLKIEAITFSPKLNLYVYDLKNRPSN